jgi:ribosomal protein S27E
MSEHRQSVLQREWYQDLTHDERLKQYNSRVAACQCTACGRLGDVTMGNKQATVACSACGVTYVVKSGSRGFKEARLRVQAIDGHGLEGK